MSGDHDVALDGRFIMIRSVEEAARPHGVDLVKPELYR
jgi:hypothetical protein